MSGINIYECPEQPSREYKIAVYTAWLDGKPINYKSARRPDACWSDAISYPNVLSWVWEDNFYRVDPASKPLPTKRIPLNMDNLPPVFWVQLGGFPLQYLVTEVTSEGDGGMNIGGRWHHLSRLAEGKASYSSDRKNWHPFYKEVPT